MLATNVRFSSGISNRTLREFTHVYHLLISSVPKIPWGLSLATAAPFVTGYLQPPSRSNSFVVLQAAMYPSHFRSGALSSLLMFSFHFKGDRNDRTQCFSNTPVRRYRSQRKTIEQKAPSPCRTYRVSLDRWTPDLVLSYRLISTDYDLESSPRL